MGEARSLTPPCFDRPPRAPGQWARNGVCARTLKPRLRWVPRWSPDRCATHDGRGIGADGGNYPSAHGWLPWCRTCRWNPDDGQ